MTVPELLLTATLLPLGSFLLLIFLGRRLRRIAGIVATATIVGGLALSVLALVMWFGREETLQTHAVESRLTYPWITHAEVSGGGVFEIGLMVDSLTLVMFVMVTLVGTLVHVFSLGYMAGDPRFSRFFAYLSLFCSAMLGLVLSNSLLQMFVCWELVGICSYLLIGFWFESPGPARASTKAMAIVNRIGDVGFLVGMGILVWQLGPGALTLADARGSAVLAQAVQTTASQQVLAKSGAQARITERAGGAAGGGGGRRLSAGVEFWAEVWGVWVADVGGDMFVRGGDGEIELWFPLHTWLPDAMKARRRFRR